MAVESNARHFNLALCPFYRYACSSEALMVASVHHFEPFLHDVIEGFHRVVPDPEQTFTFGAHGVLSVQFSACYIILPSAAAELCASELSIVSYSYHLEPRAPSKS
jgi:hypothetical protein